MGGHWVFGPRFGPKATIARKHGPFGASEAEGINPVTATTEGIIVSGRLRSSSAAKRQLVQAKVTTLGPVVGFALCLALCRPMRGSFVTVIEQAGVSTP